MAILRCAFPTASWAGDVSPIIQGLTAAIGGQRRIQVFSYLGNPREVWCLYRQMAPIKALLKVSTETVDNCVQNYWQSIVLRAFKVRWTI